MNAGCVDKACKSNEFILMANEVVTRRTTYPKVKDNLSKGRIILDISSEESFNALGTACGVSASW